MIKYWVFFTGMFICLLGLLLPYMTYDEIEYISPNLFTDIIGGIDRKIIIDQRLMTSETLLGYLSLIWMVIPTYAVISKSQGLNKKVLSSSISLFIIYIVLYFALTAEPSFYNGYSNVRLGLGFWLNVSGTLICLLSAILGNSMGQKNNSSSKSSNSLLDTPI